MIHETSLVHQYGKIIVSKLEFFLSLGPINDGYRNEKNLNFDVVKKFHLSTWKNPLTPITPSINYHIFPASTPSWDTLGFRRLAWTWWWVPPANVHPHRGAIGKWCSRLCLREPHGACINANLTRTQWHVVVTWRWHLYIFFQVRTTMSVLHTRLHVSYYLIKPMKNAKLQIKIIFYLGVKMRQILYSQKGMMGL